MYEIQEKDIRFSNGKVYHFPFNIAEALDFEDAIVVRLTADFTAVAQNIFGIDHMGNLLWKMPAPMTFSPYNTYVGLYRKGSFVEVLNWDGHVTVLQPMQGTIISEDLNSGAYGFSARRTGSPRRWL